METILGYGTLTPSTSKIYLYLENSWQECIFKTHSYDFDDAYIGSLYLKINVGHKFLNVFNMKQILSFIIKTIF